MDNLLVHTLISISMLASEHNDPIYASAGPPVIILLGKSARSALHDV